MKESIPSREYIDCICRLYGDVYDDRIEDCKPPAAGAERREAGSCWVPGQVADHKSLGAFQSVASRFYYRASLRRGDTFIAICAADRRRRNGD